MGALHNWLYLRVTDATEAEINSPRGELQKNAPTNFFRLLIARTGSKVSDRLANPKTTLAWILQTVGAPEIFLGMIVPIRESGSLLPQVFLGNYLKRFRRRKWAWTLGAWIQGSAMAACALAALHLEGTAAGIVILILVCLFSLARGISSLSAKDVLGKALPKDKRGQLTGWAGSSSGVIAIVAALFLMADHNSESIGVYASFLLAAAIIWWTVGCLNLRVHEPEGESEQVPLLSGLGGQFKLLKEDQPFRDFLVVRALAISSGLSTPYLISLTHGRLGGAAHWLGIFIIAEGLAAMLSGPTWGRMADSSSRKTLRIAMGIVAALLVLIIGYTSLTETAAADAWIFPALLFINGLAHAGVRVGRKTYLVNLGDGNKRTDYVAVGNTLIGVILLVAGLLTGFVALFSVQATLALLAAGTIVGLLYGGRLRE